MDPVTRQQLIDATEGIHEENNWPATEALWRPYVEQGDLEAQFQLAYYLFYSFDEEARIRAEMVDLLRTAADRGHPDAVYFLSHLSEGHERDALLLKAGELGSLKAQRDLGAYYATGNWTAPSLGCARRGRGGAPDGGSLPQRLPRSASRSFASGGLGSTIPRT